MVVVRITSEPQPWSSNGSEQISARPLQEAMGLPFGRELRRQLQAGLAILASQILGAVEGQDKGLGEIDIENSIRIAFSFYRVLLNKLRRKSHEVSRSLNFIVSLYHFIQSSEDYQKGSSL